MIAVKWCPECESKFSHADYYQHLDVCERPERAGTYGGGGEGAKLEEALEDAMGRRGSSMDSARDLGSLSGLFLGGLSDLFGADFGSTNPCENMVVT